MSKWIDRRRALLRALPYVGPGQLSTLKAPRAVHLIGSGRCWT